MLPHPDTVGTLRTLEYQERLRDAAQERLAASAEMGARSRTTRSWPAGLAPSSWLMGWVTRVYGAQRVRESLPPAPNPPRPVHHGA
jgi:hypothetical protein